MKYLIFAVLSSFILSCSSNDDSSQELDENQLFIKQVNEDGLPLIKYTYTNNRISSKEYYDLGQLYRTDNYEYSNDMVIVSYFSAQDELTSIRKYFSVSNDISRRDACNENGELINYRVYSFSNNTCGFVSIDFYNDNDQLNSRNIFQYVDENCSMESTRFNSSDQVLSKEQWIRDDKNFHNEKGLLDFFRHENLGNTLTYTKWNSNDVVDIEFSYESSFEYNSLNYPISEQRTYLNGSSKEITYEYY